MIAPTIEPWYAIQIRIYTPGPLLPLEPGQFEYPPDDTYIWASGIQLEKPDSPELKFGFRANDGTEINTSELPRVIDLVESIVQRSAVLPGP